MLSERKKYYGEKDRLIMNLFRTEPQKAFALLFEIYHKPLCLYAVQLTDSFDEAEDIVQDLFISLWEKKSYLNITVNLRGYLFLAVRNNTYLLLRKKNLVSMEEILNVEIDTAEDFFDYDEEYLREKEIEVMKELKKLPRQELAVIKAVVMENKKHKAAATELGISVNTLKTHLSRAMKRLRNMQYFILFTFPV